MPSLPQVATMRSTDRRAFLLTALAAAPLVGCGAGEDDSPSPAIRGSRGVFVGAEQDRRGRPRTVLGGLQINTKLAPEETDGDLFIIEHSDEGKGGPARHVHHAQDEWFYVLVGSYVLEIGDERFELGPGDSAFAPRAVPHVWAHVSEGKGRLLIGFQPAGLMDSFLTALSALGSAPSPEAFQRLSAAHGMTVVGPPLSV